MMPYQHSAGAWTSGIGHTAGVTPKGNLTEHQAAANLQTVVLNTEQQLGVCMPLKIPLCAHDTLTSFSFNVGTSAFSDTTKELFSGITSVQRSTVAIFLSPLKLAFVSLFRLAKWFPHHSTRYY